MKKAPVGETILKYPGGKARMAERLIEIMPRTDAIVFPFFGSGNPYWQMPWQPKHVVINDLYDEVINLFEVLREQPDKLIRYVQLCPWSKAVYNAAWELKTTSKVKRAQYLLVRMWMGNGGKILTKGGFRRKGPVGMKGNAASWEVWQQLPERLAIAAQKLLCADIDKVDALKLIPQYNHDYITIYADPPYPKATRSDKRKYYKHEMLTDDSHRELAAVLQAHKGPVLLSGYTCELYDQLYADWIPYHFSVVTNSKKTATETVWLNPTAAQHLKQKKLF